MVHQLAEGLTGLPDIDDLPHRLARISGEIRQAKRRRLALALMIAHHPFQISLGLTPREVLSHERCRIAWQLIHEQGLPVAEAATRSGYSDQFYFSRVFKKN